MECWRLSKWFGRLLVERLLELAVMVLEKLQGLVVVQGQRYGATMMELGICLDERERSNITIDR